MILVNKTAFIHIPRTGGTSITQGMVNCPDAWYINPITRPDKPLREKPNWYNPHVLPTDYPTEVQWLLQNVFTVFTTVRNPWSRFVSAYAYIKKEPDNVEGFTEFIKKYTEGGYNTQSSYLLDPKIEPIVLKHEELKEQVTYIQELLGTDAFKLRHLNRAKYQPYRKYYTKTTRDLVGQLEKTVIKEFNYTY